MMVRTDRRANPRARVYLPVRLRQGGQRVVETLTKDLGVGGIRCVSQTLTPVGREVAVEIPVGPGHELVSVRGRAVWFHVLPDSEQFDLGIMFIELNDRTKRLLSTYLEQFAAETASVS